MDANVCVRWTNEIIERFLETCIKEVNNVGRNRSSFQKVGLRWQQSSKRFAIKLTQKQLKNQYDYVKGKYSGWVYLRNKTGNIYNLEMNTFTLANQE